MSPSNAPGAPPLPVKLHEDTFVTSIDIRFDGLGRLRVALGYVVSVRHTVPYSLWEDNGKRKGVFANLPSEVSIWRPWLRRKATSQMAGTTAEQWPPPVDADEPFFRDLVHKEVASSWAMESIAIFLGLLAFLLADPDLKSASGFGLASIATVTGHFFGRVRLIRQRATEMRAVWVMGGDWRRLL